MRILRIMLGGAVLLVLLAVGAWQFARARTMQAFGELVARVDTDQPWVALTFDDGPTPKALAELLPLLREHEVAATFFVTGAELARRPELGAALVADGHELGNHSYSHPRMLLRSQAFIADEIERTDALIHAAGQVGPVHFRPPYGLKLLGLPYYLQRTGRTTVLWDLEPDSDPALADDPDAIVAHVVAHARPGSIVLLHVMYPGRKASLAAVPGVLEGLKARGFRFVTVSTLMRAAATAQ
jgi:peptidoglycan/xylan/chitin deacetylase (PgdA/CDA1 family)